MEVIAGLKVRNLVPLRKAIPWTDQLAIITTKDPVPYGAAKLFGDWTKELNSQIGDTAARIDLKGGYNGLSGADIDAPLAASTVICNGGAREGDRLVEIELPKKEERAPIRVDEHGIFADKT